MKRPQVRNRMRIVIAGVLTVAFLLVVRLYYIQIVSADEYAQRASDQYVRTTEELYTRGSILYTTRDGDILSAASIRAGYNIAVDPSLMTTSPEALCSKLADVIDVASSTCAARLSVAGRRYVELATQLPQEQYDEVYDRDIDGVYLYRNQWRYYPGGSVASRIVGFVGYTDDGTELHGKFGLERQYDEVLFEQQEVRSVNFFAELFSNLGDVVYNTSSGEGASIVTSLEPSVSRMLDDVLYETQKMYNSSLTGAIVMDPMTGEIIAMNAVPTFDLNERDGATIEEFRNPLVEDVYEFGSTIKALTMAAGLDSGAVAPYTTYYDSGSIQLDTYTISNFDGRGRGTVDMQEVLNQSLNTGVSFVVDEMGKDQFRDYFLNFKLGSESGIDLPGEAYGLVDNLYAKTDVEYATASFGQGIALTPVAATRALAILGNGGRLVTPHVATKIVYNDGTEKPILYPDGAQVISPETSEEVSRMLTIVVDDALRGGNVALPNHSIAAKTGTAQIPDPVNGGYYDDKFLHSFFGYFPAFEPRFIVFLYTVEPKGVRYASETLTEPFMDITRYLINYYSIPPDR